MQKDTNYPYIFGTSITGPSHIRNNIPCQDANAFADDVFPNFGIIAIADGLGSAKKSDLGAEIAVKSVIQRAKEKSVDTDPMDLNFIEDLIIFARSELELKATEEKCSLGEFASTIIVTIIHKDSVSVAHIGDGAVVARKNNNLVLLSEPEESEYINEVTPLTTSIWKSSLRIKKFSDIECLAIFTDGCQRAVLQKIENNLIPYDGFFDPLFSYAHKIFSDVNQGEKEIGDFLTSQRMNEISEDDKTLIVAILGDNNGSI